MPDEERGEWLYTQFKEFFPGWKKDMLGFEQIDRNTILVHMKNSDRIFGDKGKEDWFMETKDLSQN